ncbi:MAG: TRAP transporter substrate-binding protein DctP, partial [Planctomycetes bacterium]|nr:TRAP transporter substrate-binding protein DctP [Planctomycetota bacterium]
MKRCCRTILAAAALALVALPAWAGQTIKLGTTVNEQDSFQIAAVKFAELVEERTGGDFVVEIYPNGALGDERIMLEGMQMGILDMGIITSGPFVNFVPEFGVLDLPFIFADNAHAHAVLDGPLGQDILARLADVGIQGLASAERGFRTRTTRG